MEFLEDFLRTKDIQKVKIFELLRCKEQEAIILQYMTKALLDGVQEVGVIELVHNCFGEQASQDNLSAPQDLQNPAKATKKTTKKILHKNKTHSKIPSKPHYMRSQSNP